MLFSKYWPLIFLFISLSCNKKYDLESCNELSMKKYRGFTDAHKKFKDNCMSFEIKYTQELCQAALIDLMQTNNLFEVKKKFGDPVESCFNSEDLQRFNK